MIEVFQSEEDGYWYFYGDDYELQGPYEDEDTAHTACRRYFGDSY